MDCNLIIPIFVNGFDHNTKLQFIQSIFFLLHVAVYSNYNHVHVKGGRLKEMSRYAFAKLVSTLVPT